MQAVRVLTNRNLLRTIYSFLPGVRASAWTRGNAAVHCTHLELLREFGHAMTFTDHAAILGSDRPPTQRRSAVLRWVVAHVPLSDRAWNRMLAQLVRHGNLDDLRWLRRASHPDRLNLCHRWLLPLKSACAHKHLLIIRFLCRILRAPPHANMRELELADSAQDVILECCKPYHHDEPRRMVACHFPTECILQACNMSPKQANSIVHAARCASRWYNSASMSW